MRIISVTAKFTYFYGENQRWGNHPTVTILAIYPNPKLTLSTKTVTEHSSIRFGFVLNANETARRLFVTGKIAGRRRRSTPRRIVRLK